VDFSAKIKHLKVLAQEGTAQALKEIISFLNDYEPAVRAQAENIKGFRRFAEINIRFI